MIDSARLQSIAEQEWESCEPAVTILEYRGPRKLDHRLSYTGGLGRGGRWRRSGRSMRRRSKPRSPCPPTRGDGGRRLERGQGVTMGRERSRLLGATRGKFGYLLLALIVFLATTPVIAESHPWKHVLSAFGSGLLIAGLYAA